MDEYKRKVAPTGMWGRKERKMSKATARAQLKEETRKLQADHSRPPMRINLLGKKDDDETR